MQTIKPQLEAAKQAARSMSRITADETAQLLRKLADNIVAATDNILAANRDDLSRMDPQNSMYDRLMLTPERLQGIAADTRKVAELPAPCGEILEERTLPNGLELKKVRVPLGTVGVIYEARPNVTIDVAALCLRAGNAVVLKGGSDAEKSNIALTDIIHYTLTQCGLPPDLVQLLPAGRQAATELMEAVDYIDVLIPRGSKGLINSVRDNAKVPVIETGAGVVHTYVDASADLDIARDVVFNAKTRRVSVCNALDCLIVDEALLPKLKDIVAPMAGKNVELRADEQSFAALQGGYPDALLRHAEASDFGREHQSYTLTVKTVGGLDEALAHIAAYSSKHSEAIITTNDAAARRFTAEVDAACCYVNTSTAFTDGAQFGLGAEIGISTQKLHARGPMALRELTTYKWVITGNGQTRP